MRTFKKYPNRRLYDIQQSKYVTVEDIRQIILSGETISVVDSRTGVELTRSVLLQIITEQEGATREPILTNRILEQLIRFYGLPTRTIMSRYIEQSIMAFLDHQEHYRREMQEVAGGDPMARLQDVLEQNLEFWNRLLASGPKSGGKDSE